MTVLAKAVGAVLDGFNVSACVLASANAWAGRSPIPAALTVTVYVPASGVKWTNSTDWRAEALTWVFAASVPF